VRFKFEFDSAFVKIAKIKCSRKVHGLQYVAVDLPQSYTDLNKSFVQNLVIFNFFFYLPDDVFAVQLKRISYGNAQ
jgi:hypothetical protein